MHDEPTRQIHLDFHTSELIPDIGGAFRKEQFQAALRRGRVNLINVFAKCHHGLSYYPTKVGTAHPNLKIDLLGGQIEACHEIGVRAPVYYTVGWSARDAETHPDWCMRTKTGEIVAPSWPANVDSADPKPTFQWKSLCPSGPYHDLIMAQTEEILRTYDVDGMWYDIYQPNNLCYCERCLRGMAVEGFDSKSLQEAERYRGLTIRRHGEALLELIHGIRPDASVYFNGLTAIERPENFRHRLYELNTKNDLEDLPTTWGGYDKFPVRSKVFHKVGKPVVAMSGKFHTAWGEFGGFKDPEAIRFEAAGMIAFGASCNFGDQLHPCGIMDETTYANIGHAYEYVERIEEYGINGLPAASLGLWTSFDLSADEGLARMLLEEQIDFDVVGPSDDLSTFETIVVPSKAGVVEKASEILKTYVNDGGSLLFVGDGVLDAQRRATVLPVGAEYVGPGAYDIDYTLAGEGLANVANVHGARAPILPSTPFLNYEAASRFRLEGGVERLAEIFEPYFSRTYGAYCGHQNTPNRTEPAEQPAAWRYGRIVVLPHALDRMYYRHGAKVHRSFLAAALRLVHKRPMIEAELPSAGRLSLLHQEQQRRYVAHLLYGPPIKRGRCEVIEDLPTLRCVKVRLRLPVETRRLRLVPFGEELPIRLVGAALDGYVETVVPEFSCHCAVVAEY